MSKAGKTRLSLSLSKDSVRYLHHMRTEAHSPSMSALVEKLVDDLRAKDELAALEAKMAAYYDNLSDAEMQEHTAWGELGHGGLAAVEEQVVPRHAAAER